MTPVDQTTFGPPRSVVATRELVAGNCFSACVASILDIPVAGVPLFVDDGWWQSLITWLEKRSHGPIYWDAPTPVPRGYSIPGGVSPRNGILHACVALDGVLVHDPHPDRTFFEGPVLDWITIHPRFERESYDAFYNRTRREYVP